MDGTMELTIMDIGWDDAHAMLYIYVNEQTDAIPISDASPSIATTISSPSASAPPPPNPEEDTYAQRYKIVTAG